MHFTILVAVYNAEPWLKKCLDSLMNQTEQGFEVICIDDCSTDKSAEIIKSYGEKVKYRKTAVNSGQAVARNLGLQEAKGELTLMVDADDWLAPDCLEKLWTTYQQDGTVDAVLCQLYYAAEDKVWPFATDCQQRILTGPEACRLALTWKIHGVSAVRTTLHQHYPYDTTCRLYSDDNTCRQHYLHSRKVALSEGGYFYRQHPGNTTAKLTRIRFDFLRANDHLRSLMEAEKVDALTFEACEDYIWKNYVGLWRQWYEHQKDFTLEEQIEIRTLLRNSFALMQPQRLSLSCKRRPCYWPIRSYRLFTLWQRLLMIRK